MSSKKKPKHDEDELFPDAPPSSKAKSGKTEKREKKPEKSERSEKSDKPRSDKPEKADKSARKEAAPEPPKTKKFEKVEEPVSLPKSEKSEPKAAREPELAPRSAGGGKGKKIVAVAAILVAVSAVGVFGATQLLGENTKPQVSLVHDVKPIPIVVPTGKATMAPRAPAILQGKPTGFVPRPVASTGAPVAKKDAKPEPRKGHSAQDLATRSASHGAIARTLEAFDSVRKVDFGPGDDHLFQDFKAKQKREAELIDQLRALGPGAVAAMKDMITDLDDPGYKLLLAKTLAGMKDQDALAAVKDLMATCGDMSLATTLAHWLPPGPDSNAALASDFSAEQNPATRAMLLRELAQRSGGPDINSPGGSGAALDPTSQALFRQAATSDPDPSVRSEAVQIIGRRGDPGDMDLMAQIAQNEPNLQIRQSAIIAYALTGQGQSIGTLSQIAESTDSQVEVRASAVLALARVGGQSADSRDSVLQSLDQIAANDPSDQIRSRAQHFAQSIRSNASQPQRPMNTVPINPARGRGQ